MGRVAYGYPVVSRRVAMAKKSIRKKRRRKPAKPCRDFPLTANGNGPWSKKIRGKVHYFGRRGDSLLSACRRHRRGESGSR